MSNHHALALKQATGAAERGKNESVLARDIKLMGLPEPEPEYRFAAEVVGYEAGIRKRLRQSGLKDWRLDFAWPRYRVAFEIEGAPGRGRHTTAAGFTEDCRKYAEATLLGWTVYRVPGKWCKNGEAIQLVIRALKYHGRLQMKDV